MKTQVVNLFGGPCVGKSKIAYGLCSKLKDLHINCELVTEVAKDYTYEKSSRLKCQPLVTGEQTFRVERLLDTVDFIVTDSPILLGSIYSVNYPESINKYITDLFNMFNNVNYLLSREEGYSPVGRNQTREEAEEIDLGVIGILEMNKIFNKQDYKVVGGGTTEDRIKWILNDLLFS